MIIDGTQLARGVEARVASALAGFAWVPTLAIVTVGDDPVTARFVRIKKNVASRLGVPVLEHRAAADASSAELCALVASLGADPSVDGIVVQLPLPAGVDTDAVLAVIPLGKDVDVLSRDALRAFAAGESPVLPPVAAAVQAILESQQVALAGVEALVLGYGRLVGMPVALLLRHGGAHVTVIDQPVADLATHVRDAEVVVTGVGKSGLVTPEMLAPGAVVIDAGTSESGGKLVGDADPRCADVASVMSPVPGGVGPIAVVMIFKNLCILARITRLRKGE